MAIELSDDARRLLALCEDVAEVTVRDCLIAAEYDLVVFVVPPEDMGEAIGPGGRTVQRLEGKLDRDVKLVADADVAADFVANALAPAAVYNVTISENGDVVAYVEVADEDRGVAIGKEGRTIDIARQLANRHFDIDGVELT
jgi:N utilization substance protein A